MVLRYQAVSADWDAPVAATPRRFESQLRGLLRLGYRPARLSDALLRPERDRTFVVTFDGAFASVARTAGPILERLGVPATLYVPTGWVAGPDPAAGWAHAERWRRPGQDDELALMSWDDIRALAARGWEVGANAHHHPFLTRLDDAALDEELVRPRAIIEAELGRSCESVAYPYGDVDPRVVEAARRAGYVTGVAGGGMDAFAGRAHSDPLRWRRLGIRRTDGPLRSAAKLARAATVTAPPRTAGLEVPAGTDAVVPRDPTTTAARIAVVMPCFNDGPLALEAVASMREDEPVELVVVDDASNDPATAVALDALRARGTTVLRQPENRGQAAARRAGLAATSAPFVFPLDADDLVAAGALGRLADRLEAAPTAAAAFGDVEAFGTRSAHGSVPATLDPYRVAFRNDYPVCSMFRRTALEEVGAWQDVGAGRGTGGLVGYEDWNLWMTLAERGMVGVHGGPGFTALHYRLHGPRALGEAATRHAKLYAELRRTHPRLFAELGAHRRRSSLGRVQRFVYPLMYGARPPLGLRSRLRALTTRVPQRGTGTDG